MIIRQKMGSSDVSHEIDEYVSISSLDFSSFGSADCERRISHSLASPSPDGAREFEAESRHEVNSPRKVLFAKHPQPDFQKARLWWTIPSMTSPPV